MPPKRGSSGTPNSRKSPRNSGRTLDDRAAASAELNLTVREYLFDILDDSTRKLYNSVASDPLNVEDGVWDRIFPGIRPSVPEMMPDISVYPHNPLLNLRPKKVTPDTLAAFRSYIYHSPE